MRRPLVGVTTLILLCASAAHGGGVPPLSPRFLFVQVNASAPAPIITVGEDKVPNQYLVVFRDDVLPDQVPDLANTTAAIYSITVQKVWSHALKGMFVNMTEAQAAAVSLDTFVKYVEENARWHLSSSQQTYVDPRNCDPTAGNCPTVVDDRLWHIDRLDQNYASPTGSYAYCSDGTGVTVYEVDAGVDKFHNEFGPAGSRIMPGFNSSGDSMPADNPCMGFMVPPVPPFDGIENFNYQNQYVTSSHGTSVASALGGNRVGVAKNVTIVPIKTIRCDQYASRYRLSGHFYTQNQTMFEVDSGGNFVAAVYRALNSGTTASTDPYGQGNWPTADNTQVQDGGVTWLVVPRVQWSDSNVQTTQMIIDGLDWILSPG
jgi:subtilisin family serine protease